MQFLLDGMVAFLVIAVLNFLLETVGGSTMMEIVRELLKLVRIGLALVNAMAILFCLVLYDKLQKKSGVGLNHDAADFFLKVRGR